jgi:hypothetical protein
MGTRFWTEKQMEDWLQSEAREVTLPDGSRCLVRDIRLLWDHFDYLTSYTTYSEAKLVELALISKAETGRPFEQSFCNVVAYVYLVIRATF